MSRDALNTRDASVPAGVAAARIARILVEQPAHTRVAVYWTERQLRVVPFVEQVLSGEIVGIYDAATVTIKQLVDDLDA